MSLFFLFVLVLVGIAALAWLAVSGQPTRSAKAIAYVSFVVSVTACGIGFSALMGKPKPVEWTFQRNAMDFMAEAEVIAARLVENEAIYVWLDLVDDDEPSAYRLPWSEPMARSLHEARREAEQRGTQVKIADNTKKREKRNTPVEFYAAPVQPGPAKQLVDETPIDANLIISNQ